MKKPFMSGYAHYDTSRGFGSTRQWRAAFTSRMDLDEARTVLGRRTPEQILNVAPNSSWPAIQSAFRKAAMGCHPDRCAIHGLPTTLATERFKEVQAAMAVMEARRR